MGVRKRTKEPYIIAIDFDGCIATGAWPDIDNGELIEETVNRMFEQIERVPETVFVLWTCREGEYLRDAIEFCVAMELPIKHFNENHPSIFSWFTDPNCRKIFAHEYWDDRAVQVGNLTEFGWKGTK